MTAFRLPLMLLTVASEYITSACESKEKIFARSASVAVENSEERLQMVPVERFTIPFVISEIHCLVFVMETL